VQVPALLAPGIQGVIGLTDALRPQLELLLPPDRHSEDGGFHHAQPAVMRVPS
jgi:hypothetical protein